MGIWAIRTDLSELWTGSWPTGLSKSLGIGLFGIIEFGFSPLDTFGLRPRF